MRPLVTVIIPTFNRPGRLVKALSSIEAQTIGCDNVEAVVVNDGGPSVANVVCDQNYNFTVRLLELRKQGGVSAARNKAIDIAAGKHIAFLDDDDLFLPEHLASGLVPLESGEADFAYTAAVVADRWLDSMPEDISQFPLKAYPWNHEVLQVVNYLHTGSIICRNFRDTSIRFDTALEVCEDWDLWLALAQRDRTAFVNKITCVYHQIPGFVGLVSEGGSQHKFQFAFNYIYKKTSTSTALAAAYRRWMLDLEQHRSGLILEGRQFNFVFDNVLKYLYGRMSRQQMPETADIGQFFSA